MELDQDKERDLQYFRAMIPNLGYAYPQGYEPGDLGVREKKRILAGKGTILGYIFTVKHKKLK